MKKPLDPARVNAPHLEDDPTPRVLTWTSKGTLAAGASVARKIPVGRGGQVGRITANVDTGNEPSGGALEIDVLFDGSSAFSSGYLTIRDGESVSDPKTADAHIYFTEGMLMTIEIVTVSSAVGPLVVQVEYLPGD